MKHSEAFDQIKRGFESGRLAQGYVVSAQSENAWQQLIDDTLQLFFCTADEKPCCVCKGCQQALDHSHVDLLWMSPQKKSRIISVESIRSMEDKIYKTSYAGGWKVGVIEHADRMKDQAANAFLKTLEEPPAKTIFFLLTNSPQVLLPTIISRCQKINVTGSDGDDREHWHEPVLDVLADIGMNRPIGDFAVADRMLAILKELKAEAEVVEKERVEREAVEVDDETLDARITARYKGVRSNVVSFILSWYRDLYVLVNGGRDEDVMRQDRIEVLQDRVKKLDYRSAMNNLTVIEEMNSQLEGNVTEKAVLNFAFSRLN